MTGRLKFVKIIPFPAELRFKLNLYFRVGCRISFLILISYFCLIYYVNVYSPLFLCWFILVVFKAKVVSDIIMQWSALDAPRNKYGPTPTSLT